jgi:hypothetical protein
LCSVGLGYANVELKTEVQNLSLRVTESRKRNEFLCFNNNFFYLVEKRFSNSDIKRLISSIEQIKSRINVIERWNVSYIYDRLQKLQTDFNQIARNRLSAEVVFERRFFHCLNMINLVIDEP